MLSKEAVDEFKVIYKQKFGVELTTKEAELKANNLIELYEAVYAEQKIKYYKEQHNK